MGTNFYLINGKRRGAHIGKRSAAGLYCWDCGQTLCLDGEARIHNSCRPNGTFPYGSEPTKWAKECPKCGKKPIEESLDESSAGRELGFVKTAPAMKTGVRSCSSFTWAIDPPVFKNTMKLVVQDEYGRRFTAAQFEAVLDECPVRYFHSVGKEFS